MSCQSRHCLHGQRMCQPLPAPASKIQFCKFVPASPSSQRLGCAVQCRAMLCSPQIFLFQVPLLAHESITEPEFDSDTQALVFHLKCRWRTELQSSLSQNSPVQHCSPQMMGNFCLRPCLSAISIFFRTYALAKEKHATPPIAALQYCTSLVKAVPFSSTKALRHREG